MFVYSLAGLQLDESAGSAVPIEENETTARSAVYQLLGQLFSPPDADHFEKALDGRWAKELREASVLLSFGLEVPDASAPADRTRAAHDAEFSRSFPEHVLRGTSPEERDAVIEELRRSYEYFGLRLAADHALPADHVSVGCDFMQFLTFKEASASSDRLRKSYRRAQADFLTRHLQPWTLGVAAATRQAEADPFFGWAADLLGRFVTADTSYIAELMSA